MPTPPFLLTTAQMRRLSPHFPLSHGIARVDDHWNHSYNEERSRGSPGLSGCRRGLPACHASR
jgi:hypothetical protein